MRPFVQLGGGLAYSSVDSWTPIFADVKAVRGGSSTALVYELSGGVAVTTTGDHRFLVADRGPDVLHIRGCRDLVLSLAVVAEGSGLDDGGRADPRDGVP